MESPCEEVYVAVGKDLQQNISTLHWTLHNKPADSLVLLHVRLPIRTIPSPIGKIPVNQVRKSVLDAHEEDEKLKLNDCMEFYLHICSQAKVKAKALVVMRADVRRGIVEMVSELGITKLIMGTSSAGRAISKRKLKRPGKAGYVLRYAINFCDISIVCNGKLLVVREGSVVDDDDSSRSFPLQPNFQPGLAALVNTSESFSDERRFTLNTAEDCTAATSEVSTDYTKVAESQQIDGDEAQESTTERTATKTPKFLFDETSEETENAGRELNANAAEMDLPRKLTRRLREVEEELQAMVDNRRSLTTQLTKFSYERHQAIQKLHSAEEKFAAARMQTYFILKGKDEKIKELQDMLRSRSRPETLSSPFTNVEFRDQSLEDVMRVFWCIIFILFFLPYILYFVLQQISRGIMLVLGFVFN